MNDQQELFFTHLDDSLAAFKVALRRAINIDDNRESHLDDAGAARDELARAAGQLLFSLGVPNLAGGAVQGPLASVTVPPGTDVYAVFGTNLPGNVPLLRTTFVEPYDQQRDAVVLNSIYNLIPRL